MINNLLNMVNENGIGLTLLAYIRRIVNLFYRTLILGNSKMCIDYTAKIEGLRNIVVNDKIYAGKHFWLATYEHYQNQSFKPKIVFKGSFYASDFCHIGATNYVEIGDNVLFGSKVYVTDHGHGIYSGNGIHSLPEMSPVQRDLNDDKQVIIGDNVWVGDNVVILPGVTIGNGCVIGSNAVVTKDLPDNCIAVGIPAKVIKRYDVAMKKWEQ